MMDRRPPFAVPTGDFQFCAARATASHSPKERLAADADARTPKDVSLNKGVTCDAIGCIGKLTDGRLASMVLEIEAFAEDCARAAVVVSAREKRRHRRARRPLSIATSGARCIDRAGRERARDT